MSFLDDQELEEYHYDYQFKFILIGKSGTGKTSLLHSFLHNSFNADLPHTIGVNFSSTYLKLQCPATPVASPEVSSSPFLGKKKHSPSLSGPVLQERTVKLQLWDTAGTERFRAVTRSYYKNSIGVLLCFDSTRRETFDDLDKWLADIRALAAPNCIILVVGTMLDREEHRTVSAEEAQLFARDNAASYIEVSAFSGENVEQAFRLLAQSVILGIQSGLLDMTKQNSGIQLGVRRSTSYQALRPSEGRTSWMSRSTGGCCS